MGRRGCVEEKAVGLEERVIDLQEVRDDVRCGFTDGP